MISILLLLSAPVQSAAPPPSAEPPRSAIGRNLASQPSACPDLQTRIVDPVGPSGGLMWRDADGPVRLYRLLERRVDGCSAPIVVLDRVPGSSSSGREALPARTSGQPRP